MPFDMRLNQLKIELLPNPIIHLVFCLVEKVLKDLIGQIHALIVI